MLESIQIESNPNEMKRKRKLVSNQPLSINCFAFLPNLLATCNFSTYGETPVLSITSIRTFKFKLIFRFPQA